MKKICFDDLFPTSKEYSQYLYSNVTSMIQIKYAKIVNAQKFFIIIIFFKTLNYLIFKVQFLYQVR